MRRPISSLVIAAAIVLGGIGSSVGGIGVAQALDVAAAHAVPAAVPETTVPDTTAAPAAEEEDRTAGYVVMLAAVLVFVGGFAIIARRARNARDPRTR